MAPDPTSTTSPPKTPTSWITWERSAGWASTVAMSSSRWTASAGASWEMATTLTSLSSWWTTCSRGADSASTTMVMRLNRSSSSVGATASE